MAWIAGSPASVSISSKIYPGGRSGVGIWQEGINNVWLFGGLGMSDNPFESPRLLNDLWYFNGSSQTWHQVHQGAVFNSTVVEYRSSQIPRPRQLSAMCGAGNIMVVFGGLAEEDLALGDLWVFDTVTKEWQSQEQAYNLQRNKSEPLLVRPAPRGDMAKWCTSTHLFIFGGVNGSNHIFSDMWKLSLQELIWEEVASSALAPSSLKDQNALSYPAGRNGAMAWTVEPDNLYLFGGNVLRQYFRKQHVAAGYTSDLWQYNIINDTWMFLKGHTQPGQPGVYGHLGMPTDYSVPGCRKSGVTWTDANNYLWLFGGEGCDTLTPSDTSFSVLLTDYWCYNTLIGRWEWIGGSKEGNKPPIFRQKGKLTYSALIGGRTEAGAWKKNDNAVYLFGGMGHNGTQYYCYLNDLWLINISETVGLGVPFPVLYGFGLVFLGIFLVLCLVVIGVYVYDCSKGNRTPEWRLGSRDIARYRHLLGNDS